MTEKITYAVEYRKGTKWNQNKDSLYRYMECKLCGQMVVAGEEAIAITCSDCVNELSDPVEIGYKKSDKPRGWTLMKEFIDKDGNVYHRGVEQPKLKGTLTPTAFEKSDKPAKRMTKKEKHELISTAAINLHKLKKQLEHTRWKKDKKVILSEIKLHTKIAMNKFPRNFDTNKYLDTYKNNA